MHISQLILIKAMLGGFAAVFLNPHIITPFIIGLVIIFVMKKVFKKLESKVEDFKKRY